MNNFIQCNRCRVLLPRKYLTAVQAKANTSGKVMQVLVCSACLNIIIAQNAGGK